MDKPSTSNSKDELCFPKKRRAPIYCFVPKCSSNSIRFPNKLFVMVPQEPKLRQKWMEIVRKEYSPSPTSNLRCCEDHFDMENDIENWMRFKFVGGKLILKKDVVPHIFECQQRMQTSTPQSVVLKHERQEILQSIEDEQARELESLSYDRQDISEYVEESRNQSTQVRIYPRKRSKAVQGSMKNPISNVALSPVKALKKHKNTSPVNISRYHLNYSDSDNESRTSSTEAEGEKDTTSGSDVSRLSDQEAEQKKLALQLTMRKITRASRLYIGVPNDCMEILNIIQEAIHVPYHHILLVLKKLKLNEPFKILGDDFGLHESTASQIFTSTCCKIANVLKKFIIQPSPQSVLANLPIAFRDSFSKTYCVIDCMEIEIEIPGNALHQSLTYSSYKKCNTMKYLVSATPDGVINFVSEGFGGHTPDIRICQESNFFDCLPPGVCIMADRGFKHIESELAKRNFTLIRPPSVSSSKKISRKEVLQAKKIASLRIHIESVIRVLREFSFLKSHACTDHNLIPYLDSAIIICSALVNLQSPLIKQGSYF